jgi:hypothetical protein
LNLGLSAGTSAGFVMLARASGHFRTTARFNGGLDRRGNAGRRGKARAQRQQRQDDGKDCLESHGHASSLHSPSKVQGLRIQMTSSPSLRLKTRMSLAAK